MSQETPKAFFSYSREDTAFVMQLAKDLRAAGASVWLDQLDIHVGQRWDASVEEALHECPQVILVVSPGSVASNNVMDEVSFAIDEHKTVIPVLYKDCKIPFRLRRLQYLDARSDYSGAVRGLLRLLGVESGHATSQPMLMLDQEMFDQAPVEEAKEKGLRPSGAPPSQTPPAVVAAPREPEQKAPAATVAVVAKAAPVAAAAKSAPADAPAKSAPVTTQPKAALPGRGQTKNLAIAGGAAVTLGAVLWLVASALTHHDSPPAPQAQTPLSSPANAAPPTGAAAPATSAQDSTASPAVQTAIPAATAPARPVRTAAAPVGRAAKSVTPDTQPALQRQTMPQQTMSQLATPSHPSEAPAPAEVKAPPPAYVPPAEPRAPAAAPSISLPAVFVFKTRSKLHSYTPLRMLGSQSDRLTLNSDGSFALKQGKQTLYGTFTLSGTRLVLAGQSRTWTNTVEGATMVDEDGSIWSRQK